MFSSESFILTSLKLRPLINFEFLFVYGVTVCPNFIFFHVAVQFSQHHMLERLFSTVYPCLSCHRLGKSRCLDFSVNLVSCSTDLYFSLGASATGF